MAFAINPHKTNVIATANFIPYQFILIDILNLHEILNMNMLTIKLWSPKQICGYMKRNCDTYISHETIYSYLRKDKQNGGTLYKSLRRRGKKYRKRGYQNSGRGLIPNRVGIEERPEIVERKERIGDFELDTIRGANQSGAIVTIVDRKSKHTFMALLSRATAKNTEDAIIGCLENFSEHVMTMTSDNGKEFANHLTIAEKLKGDFYFARPYRSGDRGLNENTKGLIRQFFPKGTDFTKVTKQDVKKAEYLLNTRPRKALGYRTPLDVLSDETGISPYDLLFG